ncbi:MAG: FtsK/SpoIIIE domain-containing protein [Bacteriovoracaceae bacterium]|jgi:S-DNA-T family DNA segregation ATPase FtsK/SpoIIIE|nr:FtsK/SpoIIIE domain-containing protein [Bacteriovoracaceae bacterium]
MNKKENHSNNLGKFILGLGIIFGLFGKMAFFGIKKVKSNKLNWRMGLLIAVLIAMNISLLSFDWDSSGFLICSVIYSLFFIALQVTILGIQDWISLQKIQNNLNLAGLKNVLGLRPKVIRIIKLDEFRTKLIITAKGVGINQFSDKKGQLESAFQETIELIKISKCKKFVEITLCKRELPSMIPYSEITQKVNKESSFGLGESLSGGFLTQDLTTLPHLLIGGTTGGGKSVFFKSTLLSLLKTTPHVQMYLIDLKKGLEVKEFGTLPNVKIAKNEHEAIQVLQSIKDEMDKRYIYLEEKTKRKTIIPKLDKKDLIVIGVDEASVLYGKTTTNKTKKELVEKARELTDELSKLARAAGIHLIIATQKPIKDSIDTKTLENLPGRMSFKMSTHAGSNSMLGNAKAYALPDIKGRAIWKGGNKFIEVQTPYISEKELEEEISGIQELYDSKKFKNFEPLIELKQPDNENKKAFKAKTTKDNG